MERDMASIILQQRYFEQDFGREVHGYSKQSVDEFLDDVIRIMKLMQRWLNHYAWKSQN